MTTEELEKRIQALETDLAKATEDKKVALGENFKLSQELKDAEAAREEAAERAEREAKDVDALEKRLSAKFQKDIDKLTAERDAANTQLRTTLVDIELSRALASGNVRDGVGEVLEGYLKSKVQYEDGAATIDGKPIADFVGDYLGSEAGAHFRRAADNSGSGATGNQSTTKPARMTKETFNYTDFGKLMVENPAEANALADQLGRPELKSR